MGNFGGLPLSPASSTMHRIPPVMRNTMSAKDEVERTEERWDHVAEDEGHECGICGASIIYDERDVYFRSGFCAACESNWSKAD
jgi:hypothetical protein